jgi:GNAT superfamily N-acetyltransferase
MMEHIPHEKTLSSYPATLIGRLAVSEEFQGKSIGSNLLDYIKLWIMDTENKTGCRFLTVDAYNNEVTGRFYEVNGFKYLFSSEQQEKDYIGLPPGKELKTRLMYFDLMLI